MRDPWSTCHPHQDAMSVVLSSALFQTSIVVRSGPLHKVCKHALTWKSWIYGHSCSQHLIILLQHHNWHIGKIVWTNCLSCILNGKSEFGLLKHSFWLNHSHMQASCLLTKLATSWVTLNELVWDEGFLCQWTLRSLCNATTLVTFSEIQIHNRQYDSLSIVWADQHSTAPFHVYSREIKFSTDD